MTDKQFKRSADLVNQEVDALEVIRKAARRIRANNPDLSESQAYARALQDNPEAYEDYMTGKQWRAMRPGSLPRG